VGAAGVSSFWLVSGGLEKEKGEGDGSEGVDVFGAGMANGWLASGVVEAAGPLAAVPPENIEEKGLGLGLGADGAGVTFAVAPLEVNEEKGFWEGVGGAGVLFAAGAVENIEAKGFAGEIICGGLKGC